MSIKLKQQPIGERIKSIRLIKSLKQKELASMLATKSQTISQIENNRIYPSFNVITMLVEALRIDALWLLTGKGFMFSDEKQHASASSSESVLREEDDSQAYQESPDMCNLYGKTHRELQEIIKYLNDRLQDSTHRIGELKKELITEKDRIITLQRILLEERNSSKKGTKS